MWYTSTTHLLCAIADYSARLPDGNQSSPRDTKYLVRSHPDAERRLAGVGRPGIRFRARAAVLAEGALVENNPALRVAGERDRDVVASGVVLEVARVASRTQVSLSAGPRVHPQLRAHAGAGWLDGAQRADEVLFVRAVVEKDGPPAARR